MPDTEQLAEFDGVEFPLLECGVDYITATATHSYLETPLREIGAELVESEAQCGNEVRKWRGLGYHGKSAGSASFGVGPQGVLVRASSGLANEHWRTLAHWSTNVTRIDVQVTLSVGPRATEFISSKWDEARRHWLTHPHLREPRLRSGVNGAETVELGSRQSERCGRIYNKFKETKLDHYRGCVRFEAEFKGGVSKGVAADLLRKPQASTYVIPHVLGFFRKQRIGLELKTHTPTFFKGPPNVSDRGRKLVYLQKSIRPLVMRLIEGGELAEVISALGLTEVVTPSRLKTRWPELDQPK